MLSNLLSHRIFIIFLLLLSSVLYADEFYRIEKGDTLRTIAKEKYGDAGMWQVIYSTNKERLNTGKDSLKIGWELKLPNLGSKQTPPAAKKEKQLKEKITSTKVSTGPEKQEKILPPISSSSKYKADLRILFLGQLEGNLMPDHKGRGGILYIDAIANKFKSDNSLFLSVGDDIQGNLLANISEGEAVIKSYSMLGIQAMNIGNHEFDYNSKRSRLKELLAIANEDKEFTFLSANIEYDKKPFQPYKIYNENTDFSVAVIGLIGMAETSKIHPLAVKRMNLKINDPINTAKKIITGLKEKPKVIIVLSDMSAAEEEKLAKSNLGIDFILGVSDNKEVKKEKTYGKTTILRLKKESGRRLGVVDVFTSKNKGKMTYTFYQVATNAYETIQLNTKTNPILSSYIEKKDAELNEMLDIKVANTDTDLIGDKYSVRTKETNLGNLITDALLKASERAKKNVDAVFIHSGSIQSDIPKGEITFRMIERAMPYPNKAVVLELTGEEVYEMLEHSVSRYKERKGRFLQVSKGFQYEFSCDKKNERILKIKLKSKEINPARIYRIMVSDFIAEGGDKFKFSLLEKKISTSPFGNKLIQEIIIDYLKKEKYISPKTEKRIVVDENSCSFNSCSGKDSKSLMKMEKTFKKTKEYETSGRYKRMKWDAFLNNHNKDMKCTNKDNEMMDYARQQKEQ